MIPTVAQASWGPIQWAFVGFVLGVLFPFVLLSLIRRLSSPGGSDGGEVVGPHVVRRVTKVGSNGSYRIYQCKYCGKERERTIYFRDENCEEFDAYPG